MCGTHDLGGFFGGGYVSSPQIVRTRAICQMPDFTAAGVAVTLPQAQRLDCLSQVLLRRAATEMPGGSANAYERGQKTCAGDGDVLHLGLKLFLLFYYAPLFLRSLQDRACIFLVCQLETAVVLGCGTGGSKGFGLLACRRDMTD